MRIKSISIIIVNWNSGGQLSDVVSSIALYSNDFVKTVIIVDNGSTDDSLHLIEKKINLPFQLQIICNEDNKGFGSACNQGASLVSTEYLLFLNPDTRLFEKSLSVPLAYMENPDNRDVAIAGIQLLDEKNHISRSCARFPVLKVFVVQVLGLNHFSPLRHLNMHMTDWSHDETRFVDHVIGAFYFIRRGVFVHLGGFDDRFFVYLEDLDFSYRAKKDGWRSVYLSDAQAFHIGGGTSNQVKAKRLFYSLRSRLLYAFKHFSVVSAVVTLLATLFIEPISRSALALGRRSWSSLKETWQGYAMLWRWLPEWVFKGVTR